MELPGEGHLLITTSRYIFTWDASTLGIVFKSSRRGIVAARGIQNGSGLVAVASKEVVVLHDSERGRAESWGLQDCKGAVRHLLFSNDAMSLYLTTATAGAVQHYDMERARLLSPVLSHPSVPTALAISCTGHLLISASDDPPVVYLKNLTRNTPPRLLQFNASTSPVTSASFHPERPNVFLLVFKDATLAAYDTTKLSKHNREPQSTQLNDKDGEIGHFENLHHATSGANVLSHAAPIAGAAFLPGFKTRAATAGSDGKCRIVDFSAGVILRTWHAKAPLTSLSVIPPKRERQTKSEVVSKIRHSSKSRSNVIGGPTSTSNLLAVSRVDGIIHLYDTIGRPVGKKTITSGEDTILSIEWVKGQSPRALDHGGVGRRFSDAESPSLRGASIPVSGGGHEPKSWKPEPPLQTSALRSDVRAASPSCSPLITSSVQGTRRFTVHPDEVNDGTVRHTPSPNKSCLTAAGEGYQDLFSPVKVTEEADPAHTKLRLLYTPRDRRRISSQTFAKTGLHTFGRSAAIKGQDLEYLAPDINNTILDTTRPAEQPSVRRQPTTEHPAVRPGSKVSIQKLNTACRMVTPSNSVRKRISPSRTNAKILANLRSLDLSAGPVLRKQSTLLPIACSRLNLSEQEALLQRSSPASTGGAFTTKEIQQTHVHVNHRGTWPTDSDQNASFEDAGDDIWLTSESDHSTFVKRKRTMRAAIMPSRKESLPPNSSCTEQINAAAGRAEETDVPPRAIDGSTEDDLLSPRTQVSPGGTFSLGSGDVRELFPRSSSLSPRKRPYSSKKPVSKHGPKGPSTLTRMAIGAANERGSKPARVKFEAGKTASAWLAARATEDVENVDPQSNLDGLVRSPSTICLTCPATRARVQALENEVAHLKGEVLGLKAVLRREGISFPTSLR